MSQKDLAAAAGVDVRQIRRYEAGEQQPLLSVAVAIADALGISVTEQPGKPSHRIRLSGQWWASWQTSRNGDEKIASQQVEIKQEGDLLQVATISNSGGYRKGARSRPVLARKPPQDRVRVRCGHQVNSARYSWRNSATGRGGRPVICWKVPVV
jgi:transcriptional regulator with XRE-family HTH domain